MTLAAATSIRQMIRRARSGGLATASASDDRRPYASLVTLAADVDLSPLFLFSTLADHTRNLMADPRAAILLEEASRRANPQTGPRLTLIGTITPVSGDRCKLRFVARHPGAALYADFADFAMYRMAIERAHFVGGFARAVWVEASQFAIDSGAANALVAVQDEVITHLNTDHADTLDRYAQRLLGLKGTGWQAIAVDPDGLDIRRKSTLARLEFPAPVADSAGLRAILVDLAVQARGA